MQDSNAVSVGPNDAAKLLGVGRVLVFDLLRDGEIKSFRVGRRRLIPVDELRAFVARRLAEHKEAA